MSGPFTAVIARDEEGRVQRLSSQERRAAERASADDRVWFATHPCRSHRLRPAIKDELPGVVKGEWVAVRQAQPGVRFRWPFTPPPELPPPPDDEGLAHAIYELLAERQGRFVSLADIRRRWAETARTGRA